MKCPTNNESTCVLVLDTEQNVWIDKRSDVVDKTYLLRLKNSAASAKKFQDLSKGERQQQYPE
jgi:hypothetical protein